MKYYFENFLSNRSTYILAENFWRNNVNDLLASNRSKFKEWLATKNNIGERFYDGDPIFSLIKTDTKRALRIVQLKPVSDKPYLKAWVEKRLDQKDNQIEVLVLSIELSEETKSVADKIIYLWFVKNVSKQTINESFTNKLIENTINIHDINKYSYFERYYSNWLERLTSTNSSSNVTREFNSRISNLLNQKRNLYFHNKILDQKFQDFYRLVTIKILNEIIEEEKISNSNNPEYIINLLKNNKASRKSIKDVLNKYHERIGRNVSKAEDEVNKIKQMTTSIDNLTKALIEG